MGGWDRKEHDKTFEDNGYVHYFGRGKGFMMYKYVKICQIARFKINVTYCVSVILSRDVNKSRLQNI